MNIDNLTFGELKQIANLFTNTNNTLGLDDLYISKSVIIRTYSAGVWAGILTKKSGNEVILSKARRMWKWHAKSSISLSGCAVYGIKEKESRIAPEVESVWLEAIEILPLNSTSEKSILGANDACAE